MRTADGTPFFVIGDTWYATGTNRFRWYDDDQERPIGPGAGFKDYVRFRKAQGYNWVNMIAAFPNWVTDGLPWHIVMNDAEKTTVRSAWLEFGTGSAKNMDNEGGRPFLFPGKVPGYENVFPMSTGSTPNTSSHRPQDRLSECQWICSVHRGVAARRQRTVEEVLLVAGILRALHPIHLVAIPGEQHRAQSDSSGHHQESITVPDFMKAIDLVMEKYGPPPFGTLLSANANPRRW